MGEQPGVCSMAKPADTPALWNLTETFIPATILCSPEYKLGNIYSQTLVEMMHSERQHNFGNMKYQSLPTQCKECEFLFACNGECPKNRFSQTSEGEPGLNYLCKGYYQFFKHVAPYMDFMKNELMNQRPPANIMEALKVEHSKQNIKHWNILTIIYLIFITELMNRLRLYLLALTALIVCSAKADEGMWLLQLMQQQHSIDMMKKQGLKLEAQDLYNPNGVSLKDAVGIFGGGCTGEIISPEGLILTNHHCGYASIQQHSSVEHDYLTDGFWATSRDKELPTPGLKFTFIERIEDITDIVNAKIAAKEITESESFTGAFLQKLAEELYSQSDLKDKKALCRKHFHFMPEINSTCFIRRYTQTYVWFAAPPSSIGKFGGETDNWMWPRHTGDFSMFRIYADANGEPAEYNAANTPLKTKNICLSLSKV